MIGVKKPKPRVPKAPKLHLPKVALSTKAIERPHTADILKRLGAKKGLP